MKKTGRNDPCPCGSKKKYKQCCLRDGRASPAFTESERKSAFRKIDSLSKRILGADEEFHWEEFWGEYALRKNEIDPLSQAVARDIFEMWLHFDLGWVSNSSIATQILNGAIALTPGERNFLTMCSDSAMHLYEVMDAIPGSSISLRNILDDTEVVVRERTASLSVTPGEALVARVLPNGVHGLPSMEAGVAIIPPLVVQTMIDQINKFLEEERAYNPHLSKASQAKTLAPFYFHAWISCLFNPPIPMLKNHDGSVILLTETLYNVVDREALISALATEPRIVQDDANRWSWLAQSAKGDEVVFAALRLDGDLFKIETNSRERDQAAQTKLEQMAGKSIQYKITSHEDPEFSLRKMLEQARMDGTFPNVPATPNSGKPDFDTAQAMQEMHLEFMGEHYRKWLDDPIPALQEHTPRQAAANDALRPKLESLIRGLEGQYLKSLRDNQPAFDPSWMWHELNLERHDSTIQHPPQLAHERWEEITPGLSELHQVAIAQGVELSRQSQPNHAETFLTPDNLTTQLPVQRFLKSVADQNHARAVSRREEIKRFLPYTYNHALTIRKTFWVDEALAFMLSQTDFKVLGEEFRVPFPSFALVFTDRHVLGLAERIVATEFPPKHPIRQHLLRVATVYVYDTCPAETRRTIRIGLAVDAGGEIAPELIERSIHLEPEALIDVQQSKSCDCDFLRIALNAVLFTVSSEVKPEVKVPPHTVDSKPGGRSRETPVFSSDEVFFLPGSIEIAKVRKIAALRRISGGGQLIHRFMVRGHWRRPAKNWKNQQSVWVRPHWKGPDLAALLERSYQLTPGSPAG